MTVFSSLLFNNRLATYTGYSPSVLDVRLDNSVITYAQWLDQLLADLLCSMTDSTYDWLSCLNDDLTTDSLYAHND